MDRMRSPNQGAPTWTVSISTCLVINPSTQTVRPHPAPLTADALYTLIGCDELEVVPLPGGDLLWFDGNRVPFHTTLDVFRLGAVTVPGSRAILTKCEDENGALHGCQMDSATAREQIVWHPGRQIVDETLSMVSTPHGIMPRIEFVYQPPF